VKDPKSKEKKKKHVSLNGRGAGLTTIVSKLSLFPLTPWRLHKTSTCCSLLSLVSMFHVKLVFMDYKCSSRLNYLEMKLDGEWLVNCFHLLNAWKVLFFFTFVQILAKNHISLKCFFQDFLRLIIHSYYIKMQEKKEKLSFQSWLTKTQTLIHCTIVQKSS